MKTLANHTKIAEPKKHTACKTCNYLSKYGHRQWCPVGKKEMRDGLKVK